MTEVPGELVEVAADLYEAVTREAAAQGRTVRQQIEHWARVGRTVTPAARDDAGTDSEAAGSLHRPTSPAPSPETNAELDAKIVAAAEAANFGAELTARGLATVALDDEGRLVEYRPDGSSNFL